MSTLEFIQHLRDAGVVLTSDGDRLRCSANKGVLTAHLRDELTRRKAEVLALLASEPAKRADFLIEPVGRTGPLALSYSQERMWFLNRLAPESSAYTIAPTVRITGPLDITVFQRVWTELIRRHESLRTTFKVEGERLVQIIGPPAAAPIVQIDVRGVAAAEREATAISRALEEVERPFDLEHGPLCRATVVTIGEEDHLVALALHHIIADQWSVGVLSEEWASLYDAFATGGRAPVPETSLQYADYAAWQRRAVTDAAMQEQLTYWKRQLAGFTSAELPSDRPRPSNGTFEGARDSLLLTPELLRRLREVAQAHGATLFMILLAAFKVVLSRHTGSHDIAVGTPVAGRTQSSVERIVGMFVNTLVLRTDLAGNLRFSELLARVRDVALGAFSNQDIPFERLVADLREGRDHSRSPFFQVMFGVHNTPASGRRLAGLDFRPVVLPRTTTPLDLSIAIDTEVEGRLIFSYSSALFDRATIERLLEHYRLALECVSCTPDVRVSEVSLIPEPERRTLLETWNPPATGYPHDASVSDLFERHAARTPDRIAIRHGEGVLTYGDLNTRANRIARRLQAMGVGPDVLVAVGLSRSPDLVAALLAVSKAGGAYVPLDAAFPQQRLAWMFEDAQPAVLVTERDLVPMWPSHGARVLCVDDPDEALEDEPSTFPATMAGPESLAYVIFTSGSTGRPKGVQISRRALVNFLISMQQEPGIDADDRLVAVTTLSFDIAGLELYVPLTSGASVVLATREDATDGRRLLRLIETSGATIMQATPATWRLLIDAGWSGPTALRILVGGEPLPADLAEALLERSTEVWNLYGPTETTIWSTLSRVRRGERITVGTPIANTQVYILGPGRELLPIGVAGELWIGGDGLARGYLGRADLTAERFVPNPFVPGTRMYQTGDLARWGRDGQLEHLGRADDQVKIRGFRIELGEIEHALSTHPSVRQAAAIAYGGPADARLVAFVVGSGENNDLTQLREHLRERLPEYMVPSAFLPLTSLPLTSNGKVDRRALAEHAAIGLRAPAAARPAGAAACTPMEATVAAIWAEVLGLPKVELHQDFFELGGHSLLAARLAAKMSEIFWVTVPVRTMFEAPTVAQMSEVIVRRMAEQREAEHVAPNEVIELNTNGSRPPFIFMHAALQGDGFYCYNLARHLGDDQPMFALPPLGLDGGTIPATIEGMAALRLADIRRLQPKGPYYLGGFCVSGLVAFEAARQLKAAGEQVNLVVVIETRMHPPHFFNKVANAAAAVAARFAGLSDERRLELILRLRPAAHLAWQLCQSGGWKMTRRLARRLFTFVAAGRHALAGVGAPPAADTGPVADPVARIMAVNRLAAHAYLAGKYDGAITCHWGVEDEFVTGIWQMAAPQVKLRAVPGSHNTCITMHIDSLGAELRAALSEAQAGEAASGDHAAGTAPQMASVVTRPGTALGHADQRATAPPLTVLSPGPAAAGGSGSSRVERILARTGAAMVSSVPWIVSVLARCEELTAAM